MSENIGTCQFKGEDHLFFPATVQKVGVAIFIDIKPINENRSPYQVILSCLNIERWQREKILKNIKEP